VREDRIYIVSHVFEKSTFLQASAYPTASDTTYSAAGRLARRTACIRCACARASPAARRVGTAQAQRAYDVCLLRLRGHSHGHCTHVERARRRDPGPRVPPACERGPGVFASLGAMRAARLMRTSGTRGHVCACRLSPRRWRACGGAGRAVRCARRSCVGGRGAWDRGGRARTPRQQGRGGGCAGREAGGRGEPSGEGTRGRGTVQVLTL
jgi:hypothetical protein